MGWVDGDALWRFDVPTARIERISLGSGARYVSLHSCGSDSVAVAHHFDGARIELTVHGLSDPAHVLARATVSDGSQTLSGSVAAWADVPRVYVGYLGFPP